MSWNCRGATNNDFKRSVMDIKREHNPGIFVIMETKLAGNRAAEVAQSLEYPKWEIVDADGFAGGIWLLWDDSRFTIDILNKGSQVIHSLVQVKTHPFLSNFYWYFSAVYGRPQFETRCLLWDNLMEFSRNINGSWLVVGDFNDVIAQSEKFGGNPVPFYRIRAYTECMNSCGLIDLGFRGPRFTWVNMREHNQIIRERLDRAWANPLWKEVFPEALVKHLPRISSDHCPIMVVLNPLIPTIGKKPFRIEKFWMDHHSFKDLVSIHWKHSTLPLAYCSTNFKSAVQVWSKTTFHNIHKKKKEIIARLTGIQRFLQFRNSHFLLHLERDLTHEYQRILKQEEDMWFLKSRAQWIQGGQEY
ncbi:hypothetical protein SLA2020_260880 [Shorea laevis]